jgi:hypothetical protein
MLISCRLCYTLCVVSSTWSVTFATQTASSQLQSLQPRQTSPTKSPHHVTIRQDIPNTNTLVPATTLLEAADTTTTSTAPASTTSYRLETASKPIPLAATMGLIMPNPWQSIYVGQSSSDEMTRSKQRLTLQASTTLLALSM